MRKWVEYAVENYKGKNSFGFQLAKDLKEKQIERAIERYARGVQPREVAAVLDTSAFKSGKTGFLLTDRYLYSDKCKDDGPIGLMFLKSVSVKPENNSCCVLTFEDGSRREIDISVFLDVADVLNLIIEQKEKYEAEEKGRESEGMDSDSGEAGHSESEAVSEGAGNQGAGTDVPEGLEIRVEFDSMKSYPDLEGQGTDEKPGIERETETGVFGDSGIAEEAGTGRNHGVEIGIGVSEESPIAAVPRMAGKPRIEIEAAWQSGIEIESVREVQDRKVKETMTFEKLHESGTHGTAIEIVRMEDLDEPEETEEAREMRWLADFIQSEELDWGDDMGTSQSLPLEKDWIDEIDEKPSEAAKEGNPAGQEKTAEEEAREEAALYEELLNRAESGDAEAMFRAAEFYYAGQYTAKDEKQALRWFRESAKLEYVPAMLRMMRFYEKGELVKQNFKLSMSWAKKAAATGEAEGKYAFAEAYIYGGAGKQDVEAGLKILDEMAAGGDETALQKAEEIRGKVKRAKERFDDGIRQPSTASGNYEMGLYCQTGDGFYTYPKEAVQYFLKAAEKEHVHAQYQLALAYHTGEGTKKNEDECVKWLEKAAAKSHKEAMELLNEIQEKQRTKREKTEFKNHLRQAEKGDAYAQAKVAELYLNGIGVKEDVEKGIEWYEKASETDEGYAARQLAKIYSEGKYVPEDSEKAAYWRMIGGVLDEL